MQRRHNCATVWSEQRTPGFRETCDACQSCWHSCLNCALYRPNLSNRRMSRTTERVRDPELGNTCEEFVLARSDAKRSERGRADVKENWDNLFGS